MDRFTATRMLRECMDANGLEDWHTRYMTAKTKLGQCRYQSKTLLLSGPFVDHNTAERVQLTIWHEVAHALTPGANHGPEWVAAAKALGHPGPARVTHAHVALTVSAPRKFYATCEHCGPSTIVSTRDILTPKARRCICRRHRTALTWHRWGTGAVAMSAPPMTAAPVPSRPGETQLALTYAEMSPGQKAAYTKRARARNL